MKAGTVVTAEFQGVVSNKRRPAVVISSQIYHRERPDVILAVVTSQIGKSNSLTDYVLRNWQSAGLNKPSAVRIFLFTLPQNKVTGIGKLTENDWAEVRKRLQSSIEV